MQGVARYSVPMRSSKTLEVDVSHKIMRIRELAYIRNSSLSYKKKRSLLHKQIFLYISKPFVYKQILLYINVPEGLKPSGHSYPFLLIQSVKTYDSSYIHT